MDELDAILCEIAKISERFLTEQGYFNPFAVYLDKQSNFHVLAAEENVESKEIIPQDVYDDLIANLKGRAKNNEFNACGYCMNVRTVFSDTATASDTVFITLEHRNGFAAICYLPYIINEDHDVEFGETTADHTEPILFSSPGFVN